MAAGSATISVSQTSNTTGGTFNLAPATFTVNVAPPANTAPASWCWRHRWSELQQGLGAERDLRGHRRRGRQLHLPRHAERGHRSVRLRRIGSQTACCSYTDGGGLTAAGLPETYSIVDPTAPSIGYTLTPSTPDGDNGWYRGDVTLTWTVSDRESPNSLQKTGCVDQSITADQAATTYDCSASSAGGTTGPVSVSDQA